MQNTLLLRLLLLGAAAAAAPGAARADVLPLNVGIVTPDGDVTSANVMQKGTSTSHDSWDPAPFADLSTWDSPAVEFGVWIANVGGAPKDATLTVTATTKKPGGGNSNYAQCGDPTVSQESTTVHMITETGSVNDTAVRVVVNPNPGGSSCAQPGQTEIYVTFTVTTSDGKQWTALPFQWFVYTYGNPLDVSTTASGDAKDIASQGTATTSWSPGSATPHTVGSHVDTMTVYLQVPASRGQQGSNPLVLGGEDGVHLVGTDIDRAKIKCSAGTIGKACSAMVVSTNMPNTDGTWESQDVIVAGNVFSLTIAYGCQTNGYVDLEVEIPLSSGFAPVTFAWRKACAKTPGLQVATTFDSVVGSPDVAGGGTRKPAWGPDLQPGVNHSHVDGYAVSKFSLYFFVQNEANVKAAQFSSAILNSTKHPAKGAADLKCLPTIAWSTCTNFAYPKSGCEKEANWSPITNINKQTGVPSQPLGIMKAPIRATFDYSVCAGNGAVQLEYDLLFGEFDRLTVYWYKYSGRTPGFGISCANGCPSASDKVIVTNGAAVGKWTDPENGPKLGRTLLQSSWSLKANDVVSDYAYNIVDIDVKPTNRGCTLKHSGDMAKYFSGPSHKFSGKLQFTPGSDYSWDIVYFCNNGQTTAHSDRIQITFTFENDLFHPVVIHFTKQWFYQQYLIVGTSRDSKTLREDVSTKGSPAPGWALPELQRWNYCGLKKGTQIDKNRCAYDIRGSPSRSFFISNEKDDTGGNWGDITIPAPNTSDASTQYPGLHTSHFFSYNSSNMYHCNPWWDISQKHDDGDGHITTKIKDRADFIKQGKAVIQGINDPVNLTIVYNCSTALSKCQEPGKCAALFTGYIPIKSQHCDDNHATDVVACSPPLFRWIKTVAPGPPLKTTINGNPGKDSINMTWPVPDSGAGADKLERQLIKQYTVTVTSQSSGEVIKTYTLPVDEAHPEYFKRSGELIDLYIDSLNETEYSLTLNTTNTAGFFRCQDIDATTDIKPSPKNVQSTWKTVLISAVVGVCLIVSACGMYHYCIKSSDSEDELKQSLMTNSVATSLASPVAAAPKSPDFYPPATVSRTVDEEAADDAMRRLMENA